MGFVQLPAKFKSTAFVSENGGRPGDKETRMIREVFTVGHFKTDYLWRWMQSTVAF